MSVDDPQSFNRYAYVGNDPVNRVDPNGLYTVKIVWVGLEGDDGDRPVNRLSPLDWANFTSGGRGGGIPHPMRWVRTPEQIEILRGAYLKALEALSNSSCSSLFAAGFDPKAFLQNMYEGKSPGNTIRAGNLGPADNNGIAKNAQTFPGRQPMPDGTERRTASIIINKNPDALFFKSETSVTDRAVTIIHELLHASDHLYGPGDPRFINNDKNDLNASQANSDLVRDNCFN